MNCGGNRWNHIRRGRGNCIFCLIYRRRRSWTIRRSGKALKGIIAYRLIRKEKRIDLILVRDRSSRDRAYELCSKFPRFSRRSTKLCRAQRNCWRLNLWDKPFLQRTINRARISDIFSKRCLKKARAKRDTPNKKSRKRPRAKTRGRQTARRVPAIFAVKLHLKKEWCPRKDSNLQPSDYEPRALPLSYKGMRLQV